MTEKFYFWFPRLSCLSSASGQLHTTPEFLVHPPILVSNFLESTWGLYFVSLRTLTILHSTKPQILIWLYFCQWFLLASHSSKLQLFSLTPSYLQNQYNVGKSYIVPRSVAVPSYRYGSLDYSFFVLIKNKQTEQIRTKTKTTSQKSWFQTMLVCS